MLKDQKIYFLIAKVLRICFYLSFGVIAFGLILFVFHPETRSPLGGKTLISLSWSPDDLFCLNSFAWINVGIFSLLFTPFAVVVVSFFAFLFSEERIYSLVSAGVLLILILSLALALR